MNTLKWRIIDKPSTLYEKFDIEFYPTNHLIHNFIMFVSPSFCPKLIFSCFEEVGFVFNESWGLTFYSDLDESELANGVGFDKDNVKIIGFSENFIVEKRILFELVIDFSLKVLDIYNDDIETQQEWYSRFTPILDNFYYKDYAINFDKNWTVSMKNNIEKLQSKISNY